MQKERADSNYWVVASDIHDHIDYVDWMFSEIEKLKVSNLFLLGDYCSPNILKKLFQYSGIIDMIWGNVDGEKHLILKMAYEEFKGIPNLHGDFAELFYNGFNICLIHNHSIAKYITLSQAFDFVFYGNDHKMKCERVGKTLMLNPGSLGGIGVEPSFAILEPNAQDVKFIVYKN